MVRGMRKEGGVGKEEVGVRAPMWVESTSSQQPKKSRILLCDVGYGFSGPWDYKKMAKFAKA